MGKSPLNVGHFTALRAISLLFEPCRAFITFENCVSVSEIVSTWKLTAVLLVRGVVALVPVVALLILGDALVAVLASELLQLAGDAGAPLRLVALVPAVVVAVAPLLLGHAQAIAAAVVRVLACAVV